MEYYFKGAGNITCTLCPKTCVIGSGNSGDCGVRLNIHDDLDLPYYGILSALNIDPIEKKPLYHFYPGAMIFSVGFYGCSFHCPFCQNFQISQYEPSDLSNKYVSPEDLVQLVIKNKLSLLAFTYSEPLVHFEYVLKAARIAKKKNIKTVLVTNGYINRKPAKELLPFIDALNIDLKSFNNVFYENELGGSLKPVLDFIELAAEKSHVEITTLIIPGKNDSKKEMRDISQFISSIDPSIPLHLSAYYPTFNYIIKSTPAATILHLKDIARESLKFVYPGNLSELDANTYCPVCGSLLIERHGYGITISGIHGGNCVNCGKPILFPA